MAEGNHTPKSPRLIDITGKRFGRLIALKYIPRPGGIGRWLCRCDCGATKEIKSGDIRKGAVNSCGCLKRELLIQSNSTHGMGRKESRTTEYSTWSGMLTRCRNPRSTHFHRYGGRGIVVCDRWLKFENFLADMGPKPSANYTVERIDNDGPYSPDNCKWVPFEVQQKNTCRTHFITHEGLTLCIADWSRKLGIHDSTIHGRIRRGWSVSRVLSK